MSDFDFKMTRDGAIARVDLNRPEEGNALTRAMMLRFAQVLRDLGADADAFLAKLASRPRLVLETIKRYQAKAAHLTPEMASEYAGTLLALVRS